MEIRKHALALALALGVSGTGVAFAQGMPDTQPGQGNGMMGGNSGQGGAGPDMTGGMMGGGQGGMGPGMMNGMMGGGQGGMGPGMMNGMMGGGQGGIGSGMMSVIMGGGMMPCPMMGAAGMGMMQEMLDPEQRSEMCAVMQEHRPAQFERMGRLMNLRDDLMAEMRGERPDPEEVQALHGRMAELHGEMMAEKVRMQNAMHDLMTDEQRQQLQQATPESDVNPEDHEAHH